MHKPFGLRELAQYLRAWDLSLSSNHAYPDKPVNFAQGMNGIVELSIPRPPSPTVSPAPSDAPTNPPRTVAPSDVLPQVVYQWAKVMNAKEIKGRLSTQYVSVTIFYSKVMAGIVAMPLQLTKSSSRRRKNISWPPSFASCYCPWIVVSL